MGGVALLYQYNQGYVCVLANRALWVPPLQPKRKINGETHESTTQLRPMGTSKTSHIIGLSASRA